MVNVNGVNVTLVNEAPKRVAKGWMHSTKVYLANVYGPVAEYLGCVGSITTAKHGGAERDRWVFVMADGSTIMGGNLNDLVAAAMAERERSFRRAVES